MRFSHLLMLGVWLAVIGLATPSSAASKIEAVKGKKYELGREHGPWMIMVASLAEAPPEYRIDGPNKEQAANDLVYELRKKGIPAYTYEQKEEILPLSTISRGGKSVRREVKSKDHRICVVAGNYQSSEDNLAQKTMNWIKTFNPKELSDHAVFHPTPGRPSVLSGAFLTINPMLSAEEIAQRKIDPLLLQLNAGRKYSLLGNPEKYTLVVASFRGKAQLISKPSDNDFEIGKSLDEAGRNAEILCHALRERNLHRGRQYDAYVWHERERSLVCVGGFNSDKDPTVPRTYELFAECKQRHPQTQLDVMMPQSLLVPEPDKEKWIFPKLTKAIERGRDVKPLPKHTFAFDPKPQLLLVPKSSNKSGRGG
ncbi:MAG: hypothetical protein IAG10_07730 [Planctomycetaceae bacterium]|nr:hypothetical protein [Planctomycetaceae bacterium]